MKQCKQIKTKLNYGCYAGKYRYISSDLQYVKGMCNDNKIAMSLCHEVFQVKRIRECCFLVLFVAKKTFRRRFDNFHEVPILTFHGVCY